MQFSHVSTSELGALLLALGLATASPVEHRGALAARGNEQSTMGLGAACSGMTVVGFRTVKTKDDAAAVNKNNKFPAVTPNGIDLGTAVYFSEGMGDWVGGGTDAQYCVAFAEAATIPKWQKAWIPEKYNGQTIRGKDAAIDAYIKDVTSNQYDPKKTMRFSKLTVEKTFNQMAVPFGLLDDLCGYCLPVDQATEDREPLRVDYESGDFLALAKQEVTTSPGGAAACKRGETSSDGAACALPASSSAASAASSQAASSQQVMSSAGASSASAPAAATSSAPPASSSAKATSSAAATSPASTMKTTTSAAAKTTPKAQTTPKAKATPTPKAKGGKSS